MKRYAVIMAGGVGERFWPLSRRTKPKHLWNVVGKKNCLLEETLRRALKFVDAKCIYIITTSAQVNPILELCPTASKVRIIAEPMGRDTSGAIGLAATLVRRDAGKNPSSFCVLSSDHVVSTDDDFAKTINTAFEVAEASPELVTIGIKPVHPATGYGYIEPFEEKEINGNPYYKVRCFHEKPDLKMAIKYLESGNFFWNAGIFVWQTSVILEAIKSFQPDNYKQFMRLDADLSEGVTMEAALSRCYPKLEKISIDFGVMERADNVSVVPAQFDWDDVGSWAAIERHCPKDEFGNVNRGEAFFIDSKNTTVVDESDRNTVLFGIEDLVVVHTPDATLICPKGKTEQLKEVLKHLPEKLK